MVFLKETLIGLLSAGTDTDNSEWIVLEQNDWTYLGSHDTECPVYGCTDSTACNYDESAEFNDGMFIFNYLTTVEFVTETVRLVL